MKFFVKMRYINILTNSDIIQTWTIIQRALLGVLKDMVTSSVDEGTTF